jgi:putative ABC transport system permease protein
MKYLSLILSNLLRKKLRTTLTGLSITVGFLLFGFLCAIKSSLSRGVNLAGQDRIVVRHKVSICQLLPESYNARLLQIPGVAGVAHQTWLGGVYQDPKNWFPSMAVVPEDHFRMFPEIVLGAAEKKAWLETRSGAIVGRATANRFHFKVGDRIPFKSPWLRAGKNDTWEFDIVGIYDSAKKNGDTTALLFRYDYFDEGRATGKGQVCWYTVKVADPAKAPEIARRIDEEFANSAFETKAEPEGAFAQGFASQVGDIGSIMIAILSAVFFTILLVAGNTMAQAVRERTEELGVLKALGFTGSQVLLLVLGESCAVVICGCAAGLGIAWAIISRGSPVPSMLPVIYLAPENIAIGLALAAGLGLATGMLPAVQAGRLTISEALRKNA